MKFAYFARNLHILLFLTDFLQTEGGSGAVTWNSENRRVSTVSEHSGAIAAGMDKGLATITATDVKNRMHQVKMTVKTGIYIKFR